MKLKKGQRVYIANKSLLPKGASGRGVLNAIGLSRVEVFLNEGALVVVPRKKIKLDDVNNPTNEKGM